MIAWFHHWIWQDMWVPLWPNVLAPSAPSGLMLLWHHLQMKAHITQTAAGHCPGCACQGGEAR